MIGFLCGLSVLNNSFYNRQIVYFIIWFQTAAFDELVQDTWWYLSSIYTVCVRTRSCSVIPLIYTVCFGYFNLHSLFVYLKYVVLGLWGFFSVHFNVCFRVIFGLLFIPVGNCYPGICDCCFSCLMEFVFRASWSLFYERVFLPLLWTFVLDEFGGCFVCS